MRTEDVTLDEKQAIREAITEVLTIGKASGIEIRDLDVWREKNWKNENGKLIPDMSIDWYVEKHYNPDRGQIDACGILRDFVFDSWQSLQPHYDVLVTARDLYFPDPNVNFVVGGAQPGFGTIISTKRFRPIRNRDSRLYLEGIKQEGLHELGHVLNLPNGNRGYAIEDSLGPHCTNQCAMRQGIEVPNDWVKHTQERLRTGIVYCGACERELIKNLQQ